MNMDMDRRIFPTIGKGKNMSISKAALIVFFQELKPEWENAYIYSGDLKTAHDIIDVAGAKHCSATTTHQVLNCLNGSPYWCTNNWQTKGWGNRRANCYRPSERGIKYYEEKLKNRLQKNGK